MTKKTMKDAKVDEKQLKKLAKKVNRTEEQKEIKKFLLILGIVIILVIGVYFFTKIYVVKDTNDKDDTKTEVTFNYNKTILGSLFNRPYDEYYVIVEGIFIFFIMFFSFVIVNIYFFFVVVIFC